MLVEVKKSSPTPGRDYKVARRQDYNNKQEELKSSAERGYLNSDNIVAIGAIGPIYVYIDYRSYVSLDERKVVCNKIKALTVEMRKL